MIVEFDYHFSKQLNQINNKILLTNIKTAILKFEAAENLYKIPNIKHIQGYPKQNFYRIKMGDYRMGLKLIEKNIIRIIIVEHRSKIYKLFP